MSGTPDERIAEALASGIWKEKQDPKSGKKYYVNTRTRESTWNLLRALEQTGSTPSETNARNVNPINTVREDRHEKLRTKHEQIATLKASCASLEQKKVEMESEIARLKVPVEQETRQIQEMRDEVKDMKVSLKVVATEVSDKRKSKEQELKVAMAKVDSLRNQVDAEKQHRQNVETRRRQLNAEAMDLKGDLHREQANNEALKAAVRSAERKQEEARLELSRQEIEISGEEEAVQMSKMDLEAISKKKNDLIARIEKVRTEKNILQGRLEQAHSAENALHLRDRARQSNLLHQLTQKYESKQRFLKTLVVKEAQESDGHQLEQSVAKLRQLISVAQRDNDALEQLTACLEKEIVRSKASVDQYRKDATGLR